MQGKKTVSTNLAPAPKGPYSQAVAAGNFIFVAGQGPVDPKSGNLLLGDIRSECDLTLKNIEAILKAGGARVEDVVRCTVYLRDLSDFAAMNEVYARYFRENCPARTTIEASNLFGGIKVEIDAVALIPPREHPPALRRRAAPKGKRSRKRLG